METKISTTRKGYELLEEWYHEMLAQHIEKASILKIEADNIFNKVKENADSFIYYSLLRFRYQMLKGNFEKGLEGLEYINGMPDGLLKYYYHFFKFIYATEVGNYNSAEKHLESASDLLDMMSDEKEKAEYNYRVALYKYYISQPTLAINYATKALDYFSSHEGYETKKGACENTLGMACITLEQFELAEEYLISALNMFQKLDEQSLVLKVRSNLGVLYAEQNLSDSAIRHLEEVYKACQHTKLHYQRRVIFLLAREHIKLKQHNDATFYIKEGLKSCNQEYSYHLNILECINNNESIKKLEEIVNESLSYFKEQELWKDIQIYTELLAGKWYNVGAKEKACEYYHLGHEARTLLKEKGRLK
ncbi:tetratricopeptide repeat protein [Bacillus cereus group sp. N24]|uniref:response regulator aspartate phosphatase n=1 Tax=Bacillus cereus group sp. N24 TaxID=2794592 RepID=UPI0018F6348C|nr:tetratricopeptide repeat protein [Bacillus cereus group sp. N24]MBJ7945070.1 tetratricopeptide repeat protein [Bacillus cereus group sp. N24]